MSCSKIVAIHIKDKKPLIEKMKMINVGYTLVTTTFCRSCIRSYKKIHKKDLDSAGAGAAKRMKNYFDSSSISTKFITESLAFKAATLISGGQAKLLLQMNEMNEISACMS